MAFPVTTNADPDPTTQIPWPSRSGKRPRPNVSEGQANQDPANGQRLEHANGKNATDDDPSTRRMSTLDLIKLSIAMAGSQVAWTIELGYGTPFLLGLGLSEQLTSLVWLAGPISGLIAQPVIGAISDASTSKYRRRYWIVLSTLVLCISTVTLAYCKNIAAVFVDLAGGGAGSWDPKWKNTVCYEASYSVNVI